MIHEWILHNGICITYHSEHKWLQIDKIKIDTRSGKTQLKSVRFKDVENGIDNVKEQGSYYWSDYSRYYTDGDTKTKGEPFSFYLERNSQFEKTYENEKNIQYLQNVGFERINLRDRRYNDRMPRIAWDNYTNTKSIRTYKILDHSYLADTRYENSWTFFERYETLGCLFGCLLIPIIIIGFIIFISIFSS